MMVVDPKTGQKVDFNSKNSIYESFKEKNLGELNTENNYNGLVFGIKNKLNQKVIKFY